MAKNNGNNLKLTIQQLAARLFAKTRDKKNPHLTQLRVEADGRVIGTNGVAHVCVQRKPSADDRGFRTLIPVNVATTIAKQAILEGWGGAHLSRSQDGAQSFRVYDPEHEERLGLLTSFERTVDLFPDETTERVEEVRRTPARARVALDSAMLAKLTSLRTQVGGRGTIKLELRGDTDPVVASWNDDQGHEATVMLLSVRLEEHEWAAGALKARDLTKEGAEGSDDEESEEAAPASDDTFEAAMDQGSPPSSRSEILDAALATLDPPAKRVRPSSPKSGGATRKAPAPKASPKRPAVKAAPAIQNRRALPKKAPAKKTPAKKAKRGR